MTFEKNLERDARMVAICARGGFEALCSYAMLLPEFSDGPDLVLEHAKWLKSDEKIHC